MPFMCENGDTHENLRIVANIVRLKVHVDKFVDKCVDTLNKRLMEGN